jgi:hypothetical protein
MEPFTSGFQDARFRVTRGRNCRKTIGHGSAEDQPVPLTLTSAAPDRPSVIRLAAARGQVVTGKQLAQFGR